MRRILVDRARDRKRLKRGGGRKRVRIDLDALLAEPPGDDLLALDEALSRLAREDPGAAELVKLRAFAGLTLAQAAERAGHRPPDAPTATGPTPAPGFATPWLGPIGPGTGKKVGELWRTRAADGALKGGPGRAVLVAEISRPLRKKGSCPMSRGGPDVKAIFTRGPGPSGRPRARNLPGARLRR